MNGSDFFQAVESMAQRFAINDAVCDHLYNEMTEQLEDDGNDDYEETQSSENTTNCFVKVDNAKLCVAKKCKNAKQCITLTDEQFERLIKVLEKDLTR